MSDKTRPVSIRLTKGEIDQLQARAYTLSASVAGVARDLIRSGISGGDNKALADRLMLIERRIVALEQQCQETHARIQSIDQGTRDLLAMFDALLKALSAESTALTGKSTGRAA
jgi:dynactin complex subunit